MKLKALRALRYASKSVLKGAVFDAKDGDVRVLVGAKIAEHYVEPAPVARKPVTKSLPGGPVPGASYTAVEPGPVSSSSVVVSESSVQSTETASKNTYKRRDMTAE